jgi:Na+:H+ antiporter, NhaC family
MKKELNHKDIYFILGLCLLLISGCVLLKVSLVFGFSISIILSCIVLNKRGFSFRELTAIMAKGLVECRIIYIIILIIGATVSIWLSSGVVPSMMYYGFEYMKDINLLFAAFLIMSISSVFMGTSLGTISTIGVAILGIGVGFGIPSHVLLGVIVSGAFIADKISPISGLLNLTLSTTNTNYKEVLKSMSITLIPTLILTSIIYYFLGVKYNTNVDVSSILQFQSSIEDAFYISPYLLLMPLVVIIMSFLGVKMVYSILTGLLGGVIVSFVYQNMTIAQIIKSIFLGYKGDTTSAKLNEILVSGGVVSMVEVCFIVMGVIALSSILEETGVISYFTNKAISTINSKKELILKTSLMSSILTTVTCDQTMGIVIPGKLLANKYDELNVDKNVLVRTISDTGVIIAPLMPWNVNVLIIGTIVGVSTGYAQYAVLCYIFPLMTLIVGSIGKERYLKLKKFNSDTK